LVPVDQRDYGNNKQNKIKLILFYQKSLRTMSDFDLIEKIKNFVLVGDNFEKIIQKSEMNSMKKSIYEF